ncbi:MAG TPA: hypothetical protein VNZ22_23215, partial [Bacillota bacterium]|nr:hypothetical protein [Bacillota bacterium]
MRTNQGGPCGRVFSASWPGAFRLLWMTLLALPVSLLGAHLVLPLEQTVNLSDTIVHGKVVTTSAKWVADQRG